MINFSINYSKETEYWRAVFTRVLHIVGRYLYYLSDRNLAFRSECDALFTSNNNGNVVNFMG